MCLQVTCLVCSKCLPKEQMNKHLAGHKAENSWICEICCRSFSTKWNCENHVKHQHRRKPKKCSRCNRTFRCPYKLGYHKKVHLGTGPRCLSCNKSFTNSQGLSRHKVVHTKERNFLCRFCPSRYPYSTHLARHRGKSHTEGGTFVCDKCGKIFSHETNLKTHMLIHGLKRYQCDKCSRSFHLKTILNQHKKSHEPKQHMCALCFKTFTHAFQLETHLNTHLGSKNFQCDLCGQRFSRQDNLKRHERNQHEAAEKKNRIRFLTCPVVACRRKFKNKTKFKAHVDTHDILKNSITAEFGSGQTITENRRNTRRSADKLIIEQNELLNVNTAASIRNKDKNTSIVTEEDNSTETMDDPENVTFASESTGTKKNKRRRRKRNRRENFTSRTDANGANPSITNSFSTSVPHCTLTWQISPGISTHDDAFIPPVIGVAVVKSDELGESGDNASGNSSNSLITTTASVHRSFDSDREKELDREDATGKMEVSSNTSDTGSNNEASVTTENNVSVLRQKLTGTESPNTPTGPQMFTETESPNFPTVRQMLIGTEPPNFPTVRQMLTVSESINTPTMSQILTGMELLNTQTVRQVLTGTESVSTPTPIVPQILTGAESPSTPTVPQTLTGAESPNTPTVPQILTGAHSINTATILAGTESLNTPISAMSVGTDEANSVHRFDGSGKEDNTETNRVHECSRCYVKFSSKILFEKHICDAGSDKPIYECDCCGDAFSSADNLEYHECQESLFVCEHCDTCFRSVKSMNRHNCRITPTHNCTNCKRKFTSAKHLRQHKCSHASYECGGCGKFFIKMSKLSTHECSMSNKNVPIDSGANNNEDTPASGNADRNDITTPSDSSKEVDATVDSNANKASGIIVGSDANNTSDAPVGSDANNKNDAPVSSGANNTSDAPVGSGAKNKNDVPVSSGSKKIDPSVGSGANNKNEVPVGSDANKGDAPVGSGANNRNDVAVGSDANNGDAPVDLDATIDWFREEPALRCTSCDTTFLSREDLILHECGKNTQDYTHQCLRCFVRFAAKEHLEMHICPGAGFSIGAAEDPVTFELVEKRDRDVFYRRQIM